MWERKTSKLNFLLRLRWKRKREVLGLICQCRAKLRSDLSLANSRSTFGNLGVETSTTSTKPHDRPLRVNECFNPVLCFKWILQALLDSNTTWMNRDLRLIASLNASSRWIKSFMKEPLTAWTVFVPKSNNWMRNKKSKAFLWEAFLKIASKLKSFRISQVVLRNAKS